MTQTIRGWASCAGGWLDRAWPTVVASETALHPEWRIDEAEDYCHRCGASAGPGAVLVDGCSFCRGKKLSWDRLARLSLYDAPLDGWLKQMKFARQWSWGPYFGERLAGRVGEPIDAEKIVVTYVPMHWRRRWRRGFNQAELMARSLAQSRGWPCMGLLKRPTLTPPQTAVVPSQREQNVSRSFAIRPVDLRGWQVVLIDDIKTTGATLGSCCKLLRRSGAGSIQVAVAAVADPKGLGFKRQV